MYKINEWIILYDSYIIWHPNKAIGSKYWNEQRPTTSGQIAADDNGEIIFEISYDDCEAIDCEFQNHNAHLSGLNVWEFCPGYYYKIFTKT